MSRPDSFEETPQPFQDWAFENGVNSEYEEDWGPWFDCWTAGYNTHLCGG